MRPPIQSSDRAHPIAAALANAMAAAGWQLPEAPLAEPGAQHPDLFASRGNENVAVVVRAIAEGRADRLIPLWSQAWLLAQHLAPAGHSPMAVVGADRVAPKAADAVLSFIQQVAPQASAGVVDLAGMRRFVGPHVEGLNAEPAPRPRRSAKAKSARGRLFSDLNQWMLKVLLAPGIPIAMLNAPRGQYRGASELAAAAGVSVMSASRLIQELRHERYLDDQAPYLRLVRVRHLLERWQSAAAAAPVIEERWRAVIRGAEDDVANRWLAQDDGCLTLFASADEHRMGFVSGVPPYVYSRRFGVARDAMSSAFLRAGNGERIDLFVRKPNAPQSLFRGMVNPRGRPACDIVQVWLDVKAHPSRGEEQAEVIWRRVLEPLCEQ